MKKSTAILPLIIALSSNAYAEWKVMPDGKTISCLGEPYGSQTVLNGQLYEVVKYGSSAGKLEIENFNNPSSNPQRACTSNVTSLVDPFYSDRSFNGPLEHWDTSNVTVMRRTFANLTEFNQPIGNWNTSKVIDMSYAFNYAKKFQQDISKWDVSSVVSMTGMFAFSIFNKPIGDWDTGSVTDMQGMFKFSKFNKPIGGWNVENVKYLSDLFFASYDFNQSLSNWDPISLIDASAMFALTKSYSDDLSSWCSKLNPDNFEYFTSGKYAAQRNIILPDSNVCGELDLNEYAKNAYLLYFTPKQAEEYNSGVSYEDDRYWENSYTPLFISESERYVLAHKNEISGNSSGMYLIDTETDTLMEASYNEVYGVYLGLFSGIEYLSGFDSSNVRYSVDEESEWENVREFDLSYHGENLGQKLKSYYTMFNSGDVSYEEAYQRSLEIIGMEGYVEPEEEETYSNGSYPEDYTGDMEYEYNDGTTETFRYVNGLSFFMYSRERNVAILETANWDYYRYDISSKEPMVKVDDSEWDILYQEKEEGIWEYVSLNEVPGMEGQLQWNPRFDYSEKDNLNDTLVIESIDQLLSIIDEQPDDYYRSAHFRVRIADTENTFSTGGSTSDSPDVDDPNIEEDPEVVDEPPTEYDVKYEKINEYVPFNPGG